MRFNRGEIWVYRDPKSFVFTGAPNVALILESSDGIECWLMNEKGEIMQWCLSKTFRTRLG